MVKVSRLYLSMLCVRISLEILDGFRVGGSYFRVKLDITLDINDSYIGHWNPLTQDGYSGSTEYVVKIPVHLPAKLNQYQRVV